MVLHVNKDRTDKLNLQVIAKERTLQLGLLENFITPTQKNHKF
jgi:hypothetical protein